jgi:hypothetical protein
MGRHGNDCRWLSSCDVEHKDLACLESCRSAVAGSNSNDLVGTRQEDWACNIAALGHSQPANLTLRGWTRVEDRHARTTLSGQPSSI